MQDFTPYLEEAQFEEQWADKEALKTPIKIALDSEPKQLIDLGNSQFLVIFQRQSPVVRIVLEIGLSREYTKRTLEAADSTVVSDMAADALDKSVSLTNQAVFAILVLQESDGLTSLALEIFDLENFSSQLKKKDFSQIWMGSKSIDDKLFAKLLPYSEYIALAKQGETDLLIHYYGGKNLPDRVIATGFSHIVDLKLGKMEKLLYVIDKST